MNGLQRGWLIAGASWTVLRHEPKLFLFPICSLVAILVMLAGTMPVMKYLHNSPTFMALDDNPKLFTLSIILLTIYVACYFFALFFNAALIFCVLRFFEGGTPSIRAGLTAAATRIPQIFCWAVIAGTVGLIIKSAGDALSKASSDRLGFIAGLIVSLVAGVLYTLWIAASYFVLPILVIEKVGPIKAVRRSVELIESRWKDVIGGEARFGLLGLLLFIPVFVIGGVLLMPGTGLNNGAFVSLVVLGSVYFVAVVLVLATLGTVFLAAVYRYATTGDAPADFNVDLVTEALRVESAKAAMT